MRAILADPDHEVCFSAASIWEIAVKAALKRVNFRYRPDEIADAARDEQYPRQDLEAPEFVEEELNAPRFDGRFGPDQERDHV